MSSRITTSNPLVSEWKGNKVLNLNPQGRANISFGLGKAMVIMENLPAIVAFLKSSGANLELDKEVEKSIEKFANQFLPNEE